MQNLEKELPGLIQELLQAPAHRQRELVERHYKPDCRLTHALVLADNREDIVRIFQYWRFANRRLDVDVNEIVVSRGGRRSHCFLQQRVQPGRLLWPLQSFSWDTALLLDLEAGPSGWQISKQKDFTSAPSLLRPLPLLGWAYESVARRAPALGISTLVWAVQLTWRQAELTWQATWLALGSSDAGPPPGCHLDGPRKGRWRCSAVLHKDGSKVWVQLVQHVTGFQHYLSPPLFGFSLPMSVLMYLADGPEGTKLICKQVDFHSFEGILYTTPGLGWLLQHGLRRSISAWMIGSAQLAAGLFPALEAWLWRALPGAAGGLEGWKAAAGRLWWRRAPPVAWRRVPAPYDPSL